MSIVSCSIALFFFFKFYSVSSEDIIRQNIHRVNLRYVNNDIAWSKANVSGGQQRSELYIFLLTYEKVSDEGSIYLVDCFSLNKDLKSRMYYFICISHCQFT